MEKLYANKFKIPTVTEKITIKSNKFMLFFYINIICIN
jgi:hypothetical protein